MQAELEHLGTLLTAPERPCIAILGGAKVSDKLGLILHLLPRLDQVLIGGGMAYTFLRAQGIAGRELPGGRGEAGGGPGDFGRPPR